jgi:hypothetical protein
MSVDVGTLLERYARFLTFGGLLLTAAALTVDPRWLDQPVAVILLTVMVLVLRAAPIRLSKYSYLTQTGIPVLVGAVSVGPTPVVLALYLGVLGADACRARPSWSCCTSSPPGRSSTSPCWRGTSWSTRRRS